MSHSKCTVHTRFGQPFLEEIVRDYYSAFSETHAIIQKFYKACIASLYPLGNRDYQDLTENSQLKCHIPFLKNRTISIPKYQF